MLAQNYSSVVDVSTVPPIIHKATHAQEEESTNIPAKARVRQDSRYEKQGKRWVRRRDNSRFAGNVHIVKPSTQDFSVNLSHPRSTFTRPLPPFLPRHLSAPSASLPHRDPVSANAGRYSLSLKGVRRELRRSGPRAEQIVLDIEQELTDWLETGGILIYPDSQHPLSLSAISGAPLGSSNSIIEVHRSPTELIWRIDEDFPRFLLHCVARFHGVVSYSKNTTAAERDMRFTYLLRPNVTRPDFTAKGVLDTPPESDVDALSVMVDTEDSDVTSEFVVESDQGDLANPSLVCSSYLPEGDYVSEARLLESTFFDDTKSSEGEREDDTLAGSVGSLILEARRSQQDWEQTPRRRGNRVSYLTSRSPSRCVCRITRRVEPVRLLAENRLRFWQYVFA